MSIQEFARRVNISYSTALKYIKTNVIHYEITSSTIFKKTYNIAESEVQRFLENAFELQKEMNKRIKEEVQ